MNLNNILAKANLEVEFFTLQLKLEGIHAGGNSMNKKEAFTHYSINTFY